MTSSSPAVAAAAIVGLVIGSAATALPASAQVGGARLVSAPRAAPRPAPVVRTADGAAEAQAAAARQGYRVEIVGDRTENSTTYANPEGTFTTDVSSGPVRVRDAAAPKGWVPLDLTLRRQRDGAVAAARHPQALRLSGASNSSTPDLASLRVGDGESVTLGWRGRLPKPELSGADATYRDVQPGVDMVVRATSSGFEQFVVLRQRPQRGRPFAVTLPLRAQGLVPAATGDGAITLTDAAGHLRGAIPAPMAWDATVDPQAGGSTNTSPVAMTLTNGQLTLTPDQAWLTDPATHYPVTIDPATTIKPSSDTWVESDYSSAQAGSTELRVGTYDGGSSVARSFLSFSTAPFAGKSVTSATLRLYQFHSWSCSARSYQVWETGSFTTSTTWKNQPSWTKQYASISSAHGYTGCAAGFDSLPVTSLAQRWAGMASAVRSLGLRAGSETDNTYWKKFSSANASSNQPTLSVTYNSYPSTAGTPAHTPGTASATATTGWTTTATPTLKATVSDPDGGSVKALFDVYNGSTLVINHLAGSVASSGGTSTVTLPAGKLVNGTEYVVRAWSNDGSLTSAVASAGYDRFTVDTSAPPAPAVASATFPAGTWTGSSGLGADGKAHFTATATSSDAHTVRWSLDATTYASSAIVPGSASMVDIALAPPAVGAHTLHVQTVDTAGNAGAAAAYTFFYGAGPLAEPATTAASPVGPAAVDRQVDLLLADVPTLTAAVGPNVGSTVDYDFEVWDGAQSALVTSTTVTGIADGAPATWKVPGLARYRDYLYRARGRTAARTGPWSSWRRLTSDQPEVPAALLATGTDTARPILSAVATRPSGRSMSLRFSLWDQAGTPLAGSPLAEVEAGSGVRTSVALPTGLAAPGGTFTWAVAGCAQDVCSAQSLRQSFTVTTPETPQPATATVAAASWAAARVDAAGCDAGTCPLQTDPVTLTSGDTPTAAFVRFTDLAAVPVGAQVVGARLRLPQAGCGGTCSSVSLDAFPMMMAWPDGATGEQLFAAAQTDDGVTVPLSDPAVDVTDLVTQWIADGSINGGLALTVDPGTAATVQFTGAPALVVDYLPPGAPSAPQRVTARAGDGGVLVDWKSGPYAGTQPGSTMYTITVAGTTTPTATTVTAATGPVIVHGLANGDPATVTVTASSGGVSGAPSAQVTVTPAAPSGTNPAYRDAVTQFHQVTDAPAPQSGDLAGPLAQLSQRSAIASAALARSVVAGQADDILVRHSVAPQADAWVPQDTLLSAGPDGTVTLRATGRTVTGGDETSDAATSEDFVFTGGTLSAVLDATSTDTEPTLDGGRVADLDPRQAASALDAAGAPDDPAPVETDDDGMPVLAPASGLVRPLATDNGVDHGAVADYAIKHAYDKPPRVFKDDDCTDFASKALHDGGGLPFRYGWYRNNKHWWSNWLNRTYSWGGVVNLRAHLGYRNVTWVRYTNQAVPGDILFWKYREWKDIGHTSVITKVSGWTVWYSQHSDSRRNKKLQDRLAELSAEGHGPVTIYIAHLGNA